MKNQVISMLELSVAAVLFMGACWYSYQMQSDIDGAIEAAYGLSQEQSISISTVNPGRLSDALTFRGSEILFMLRGEEKKLYDLSVDGVSFPPGGDPESWDLSVIEAASHYAVRYHYGSSGEIVRIQFSKVR